VTYIDSARRRPGLWISALAIFLFLLTSCGDSPVEPLVDDQPRDTTPPPPTPDLIAGARVARSARSTLAAVVTVETREPTTARIRVTGPEGSFTTPAGELATTHTLDVVGLHAETRYTLTPEVAVAGGPTVRGGGTPFTTGPLPPGIPAIDVTVLEPEAVAPGLTYFGLGSAEEDAPLYVAVDEKGEVVWYYQTETPQRVVDADVKLRPDGNLLLHLEDEVRLITQGGETVSSWVTPEGYHHEAEPLPNGNVLVLVREVRTIDVPAQGGPQLVTGDAISELTPSGQEVWRWSTFDHLDTGRFPGRLSTSTDPYTGGLDWTHSNAVVHDPGTNTLLLSVRSQHWIVKIDRATGRVLWRLGPGGDFQLEDGCPCDWFYAPHAPELEPEGTILVYDNGNERPDTPVPYSRAVRIRVDESAMTARTVWSFTTPEFTAFLGDVDLLDQGNVLVTAGGVFMGGTPRILEVTGGTDPRVVWELRVASLVYRATRIARFH
jgi:outer membrane protein assembly factor BamB